MGRPSRFPSGGGGSRFLKFLFNQQKTDRIIIKRGHRMFICSSLDFHLLKSCRELLNHFFLFLSKFFFRGRPGAEGLLISNYVTRFDGRISFCCYGYAECAISGVIWLTGISITFFLIIKIKMILTFAIFLIKREFYYHYNIINTTTLQNYYKSYTTIITTLKNYYKIIVIVQCNYYNNFYSKNV